MARLNQAFYNRPTLQVAVDLLGKKLVFDGPHGRREGLIVETEAYLGFDDRASHASRGRTPRNEPMFGPAGFSYVYLVYGMHWCLNIVTEPEGIPAAVLIRALEPLNGADPRITSGPGKLTRWLGVTGSDNQRALTSDTFFCEDVAPGQIDSYAIATGPRIGVTYAGAWTHKPWRFYFDDHLSVSQARKSHAVAMRKS